MDSDDPFDADRPPDELRSVIESDVVRPCLEVAFRAGELRRAETVAIEHAGRLSPDPDYGPVIQLQLETSAGDTGTFYVWQPDVEQFSTIAGIRANLLWQLEYWLPETQLHWGEEIHLSPPAAGWAAG